MVKTVESATRIDTDDNKDDYDNSYSFYNNNVMTMMKMKLKNNTNIIFLNKKVQLVFLMMTLMATRMTSNSKIYMIIINQNIIVYMTTTIQRNIKPNDFHYLYPYCYHMDHRSVLDHGALYLPFTANVL